MKPSSDWEGEIVVESLAPGGEGVLRLPDGRVAFVPRAIDGERVRVHIEAERGKKRAARLLEVVVPSPDRVEPACAFHKRCGGCDWMHIDAAAQGARHAAIVRDLLSRVAPTPEPVVHVLDGVAALRSRARFGLRVERGRAKLGMRAERSHDVVDIDRCLVVEDGLLNAARAVASWVFSRSLSGEIAVAFGRRDGLRMPVVSVELSGDPEPSFFALLEKATSGGDAFQLAGARVTLLRAARPMSFGDPRPVQLGWDGEPLVIDAGGFAQASDAGGVLLAERARALAKPEAAKVLELFAGSGTLSVALAKDARSFASVEQNPDAVTCARENLRARGLEGTLRTADAESVKVAPGLDVVVLDPPRAGAPSACAAIASAKPRRVVYVSCDPVTLARDAKALVSAGYRVAAVEVAPLFLHTSHVETIVLFDRSKGAS